MTFTEKEKTLLKDMKAQEELCVEKYTKAAECAHDPQLKQLFTEIGKEEQTHLQTITQIESGTVPAMKSSASGMSAGMTYQATYPAGDDSEEKKHDQYLCTDCLGTEKFASSVYNTDIFEFRDKKVRDTLNHIQKEEQEHGEKIYHYMSANGMY
ncbi:MAG: DUF892 family protein [Lachnospiraceae bacterium]